MSTEQADRPRASSSEGERRARGAARRYRRGLFGTVGALAAATVALGATSLAQGPKLSDAAIEVEQATSLAGSRLVLDLNQPIDRVEGEVRVSPHETTELEVDGSRLIVSFDEPLPYDETFTVTIDGVVGMAQPAASTVEYAFTTADEPVYTLVRRSHSGRPDVVRRSTVGDPSTRDVLEAPRLRSFAHAGDVVVAVAIEDDGTDTLRITGIADETLTLTLPGAAIVRSIGGSSTQPIVAFTVGPSAEGGTAASVHDILHTLDVSGASAAPTPVLGPDGAPISAQDWRFVPGTTSMVVQDFDGAVFLVDALGLAPPQPLGTHVELRGILPGTTELVVADPDRGTIVDLVTGEARENDVPSAALDGDWYPGRSIQLDAEGAHLLEVFDVSIDEAGRYRVGARIVRVDRADAVDRYATGEDSRLLSSCVSPNGRLLAVETASAQSESDDYPEGASPVDRLTTVIDIDTGDVVLTQNGGFSDWCR